MELKKSFSISLLGQLIALKEWVSFNEYIFIYLFYIEKSGLYNKKLCQKLIKIVFGLDTKHFLAKRELELLIKKLIIEDKQNNLKPDLNQIFNEDIYTIEDKGQKISKSKLLKYFYNNPLIMEYIIKLIIY